MLSTRAYLLLRALLWASWRHAGRSPCERSSGHAGKRTPTLEGSSHPRAVMIYVCHNTCDKIAQCVQTTHTDRIVCVRKGKPNHLGPSLHTRSLVFKGAALGKLRMPEISTLGMQAVQRPRAD